jgi:hypothetical protein
MQDEESGPLKVFTMRVRAFYTPFLKFGRNRKAFKIEPNAVMKNEGTSESICKRFRCSSSPKMAAKKNFAKKINKYETANFSRYRNLKQR